MNCNELNKTFFTRQYCNCGGEYWSTMYVGFNVPNAKCKKCGSETTLCPTQRLHIKKNILRGRDDLNSNKTPKEFCKDKDCVAKGEDKMNNKEVIKKLKELKYVLDFTNTEYLEYAIKKLEE